MSVRDPAEILERQTGAPIDEQEQKECVSLGVNGRGVNRKDHYSAPVFVWTNSDRDDHREEYESLCGKANITSERSGTEEIEPSYARVIMPYSSLATYLAIDDVNLSFDTI